MDYYGAPPDGMQWHQQDAYYGGWDERYAPPVPAYMQPPVQQQQPYGAPFYAQQQQEWPPPQPVEEPAAAAYEEPVEELPKLRHCLRAARAAPLSRDALPASVFSQLRRAQGAAVEEDEAEPEAEEAPKEAGDDDAQDDLYGGLGDDDDMYGDMMPAKDVDMAAEVPTKSREPIIQSLKQLNAASRSAASRPAHNQELVAMLRAESPWAVATEGGE